MATVALVGCGNSDPLEFTDAAVDNRLQDDEEGPGQQPPTANAVGPEGDSSVVVGKLRFPLKSALGDMWGVEADHYSVDFTITNGKFLVAPTEINGVTHSLLVPAQATATVYAELYSPGDSFSFGTYSFSPFGAGGGVLAGNAYFDSAYVGIDRNGSGDIEADENSRVIGGTFEFTGVLPDIELRFNVTLENGEIAEGHYTGLFDFADRT